MKSAQNAPIIYYCILSSIMNVHTIIVRTFISQLFLEKNVFILFFKNIFTRNNHCIFIHHRSHLKPLLSYLTCIVRREYFSIIFYVKKCTKSVDKIWYFVFFSEDYPPRLNVETVSGYSSVGPSGTELGYLDILSTNHFCEMTFCQVDIM
jgi:hypothetical protein